MSAKPKSAKGLLIGIAIGTVLTIGAMVTIFFSGLGGHGNPQNPIAEAILLPGTQVLSLTKTYEDVIPKGAGSMIFTLAFVLNVGVWAAAFRWLLWPLFTGMRDSGQ